MLDDFGQTILPTLPRLSPNYAMSQRLASWCLMHRLVDGECLGGSGEERSQVQVADDTLRRRNNIFVPGTLGFKTFDLEAPQRCTGRGARRLSQVGTSSGPPSAVFSTSVSFWLNIAHGSCVHTSACAPPRHPRDVYIYIYIYTYTHKSRNQ